MRCSFPVDQYAPSNRITYSAARHARDVLGADGHERRRDGESGDGETHGDVVYCVETAENRLEERRRKK
jgi:hypothetical protein